MYEKYIPLIKFFKKHDDLVYWDSYIPKNIWELIFDGIPEIVNTYCETESYTLTNKFLKWYKINYLGDKDV